MLHLGDQVLGTSMSAYTDVTGTLHDSLMDAALYTIERTCSRYTLLKEHVRDTCVHESSEAQLDTLRTRTNVHAGYAYIAICARSLNVVITNGMPL